MKTFAFKNRLFFTYAALIIAVVALFSAVLLSVTTQMNRQTELYHQQELYTANLTELEGVLRRMERMALQIQSNNEILGVFISLDTNAGSDNYFATNLIDSIRVSSLLSDINGTDNFAARVSVFNGHGDYVSTGTLYETIEAVEALVGTPNYYGSLQARIRQNGGPVIDAHADQWSDNTDIRLISLYSPLTSYASAVYGLMDIQVSTSVLGAYAFWGTDGEYLLLDRTGEPVYPLTMPDGLDDLLTRLIQAADAADGGLVTVQGQANGASVVVMGANVYFSDWLFVRVLPARALLTPYGASYAAIILFCLALLGAILLIIYYLAVRIARPLQSLAAIVSNVNLQNMQQSITQTQRSYSTAELDTLNSAFRLMLMRLDRSLSMEIQAHMRALQSQMNPHFLYNMLSVIIESSEMEGGQRTVAMCLKLSYMLRYIADFSVDSATLEDEVQHARNYLDLMKDRYEDLFEYEILTDPSVMDIDVPKAIIQPLAENCFTHGFKSCRPPWKVRIEVAREDKRWVLRVTDNGGGIAPEAVSSIREQVEAFSLDVGNNYQTLRLGGMGLVNTLLRLSISKQNRIDFDIGSNPEGGTTVCIGGAL